MTESRSARRGAATFSLGHRLYRFLWQVVWTLAASWTPPQLFSWRRSLLQLFGAKLARTARVYPSARIWYPRNLIMGDHACLGPGVTCYCMDRIAIGDYALVSQGAHLCGGTHDISDPEFPLIRRPIEIGAHAWIAAEAFVGPGVTIGERAVLGARAVTFKDVPSWAVFSGNPAQFLKTRDRAAADTNKMGAEKSR